MFAHRGGRYFAAWIAGGKIVEGQDNRLHGLLGVGLPRPLRDKQEQCSEDGAEEGEDAKNDADGHLAADSRQLDIAFAQLSHDRPSLEAHRIGRREPVCFLPPHHQLCKGVATGIVRQKLRSGSRPHSRRSRGLAAGQRVYLSVSFGGRGSPGNPKPFGAADE
jgi:hypothetical protein